MPKSSPKLTLRRALPSNTPYPPTIVPPVEGDGTDNSSLSHARSWKRILTRIPALEWNLVQLTARLYDVVVATIMGTTPLQSHCQGHHHQFIDGLDIMVALTLVPDYKEEEEEEAPLKLSVHHPLLAVALTSPLAYIYASSFGMMAPHIDY